MAIPVRNDLLIVFINLIPLKPQEFRYAAVHEEGTLALAST